MINFTHGNQLQLLKSGSEYFTALEAAINAAQHEIYLETYIYRADKTGVNIGQALMRAAQRGVSVCLLLDGFGSQDLPASYVQTLGLGGVKVMFYRTKISPWTFKKNRLRRLHRKLVVIDQAVGFLGGINILDDFDAPFIDVARVDYAVRLTGPLLPALYATVHKLWRRIAWSQWRPLKSPIHYSPPKNDTGHAGIKAALVLRDNIMHRRDIEEAYLSAIASATNEILIASAYFVPGMRFRKALLDAAARGVSVKLLLQGRV